MNSLHIHILEHEDNVCKFYSKKEIEPIFFWYNIEDINDWNLKLLFFSSLLLFTSNNLCLSRLESPLILMQYMYVYMHGQLRLNEWINLSCMKGERKNWLAFPSSLFGVLLMVRDFSGHHVAGSMSFSFSLSLSLSCFVSLFLTLFL